MYVCSFVCVRACVYGMRVSRGSTKYVRSRASMHAHTHMHTHAHARTRTHTHARTLSCSLVRARELSLARSLSHTCMDTRAQTRECIPTPPTKFTRACTRTGTRTRSHVHTRALTRARAHTHDARRGCGLGCASTSCREAVATETPSALRSSISCAATVRRLFLHILCVCVCVCV